MPFYDPTFLLLIPPMIFAFWAQYKVSRTFEKYSQVGNRRDITAAETAQELLRQAGIRDVQVESVPGRLTDHYDPRTRVLRLSESVYNSKSLAAIGVAAHETGHAIQHQEGYLALSVRSLIFPVVSIGSNLAIPLVMIGLLISYAGTMAGQLGLYLMYAGIFMFAGVVVFQLITLPVEFNASRRAIEMLGEQRLLTEEELVPAQKVLNAAAMTYLAAAATSIATLLRLILLSGRRRD